MTDKLGTSAQAHHAARLAGQVRNRAVVEAGSDDEYVLPRPPNARMRRSPPVDMPGRAGTGAQAASSSSAGASASGIALDAPMADGWKTPPGSPTTGLLPAMQGTPPSPVHQGGIPQLAAIGETKATRFLVDRMGSPQLAKLASYLDRKLGDGWAFTGSVALNIHSLALENQMVRQFNDADIQISNKRYASFMNMLSDPQAASPFKPPSAPGGDGKHYTFDGMAIDPLDARLGRLGLASERVYIEEIPVLTIKSLLAHKRDNLNDPNEDNALKASNDLPILKRLLAQAAAQEDSRQN